MLLVGCSQAPEGTPPSREPQLDEPEGSGQAVEPPFAVRGELEGLLLMWFDEEGLHSARKRSEIPAARRRQVRVDSLEVAPDRRLRPELVYIADVQGARSDGSYAVRTMSRSWLDDQMDSMVAAARPAGVLPDEGVTLYMASWCGACRSAASFMRGHQVSFVEKDIEKDSGAAAEMQKKVAAVGKQPRGVPVIDFHGNIMLGFDKRRLTALVEQYGGQPGNRSPPDGDSI